MMHRMCWPPVPDHAPASLDVTDKRDRPSKSSGPLQELIQGPRLHQDGAVQMLRLRTQRPLPIWRPILSALNQSPAPDQLTITTGRPETRAKSGFGVLNAQEPNRQQREKCGESDAGNEVRDEVALKSAWRKTAPTPAFQAAKSPTENGWALGKWWSWRELNPRPQAFFAQFYMCSRLFGSRLP